VVVAAVLALIATNLHHETQQQQQQQDGRLGRGTSGMAVGEVSNIAGCTL
jgi:hypothetical protein